MSSISRAINIYLPGRGQQKARAVMDLLAGLLHRNSTAYTQDFAARHGMREWTFALLAYKWPKAGRDATKRRPAVKFEQMRLPL